ncbi:hypothetical protein HUS84_33450 [Pseudomonas chlororaphis]|uniref:alpha-L-rhamnosidase-related protein n=1 Tax=Pseudomonas chlororaphis TaxID=587753 RepID=UPI001B31E2A6|nr:alpha-L-rhamnosidase C-terminal domain-containing protein [Pseudomonas chlororaphis]MBP5078739.1 hypothetical protein [Pseudomonas chlororaphis]
MQGIVILCMLANLAIQGYSPYEFVTDLIGTANRYLSDRYNGHIEPNIFAQIGVILNYTANCIGGLIIANKSNIKRALIFLCSFIPAGLHMVIYADKGTLFLCAAFFESGEDDLALALMLNKTERGWMNMLNKYDATITHEAWDVQFKYNEDWTHAWGAAPANIIPRFILGINATEPGWARWEIKPSKVLTFSAKAKIPTPHGLIDIMYDYPKRKIVFNVPKGTVAELNFNQRSLQFEPGWHEAV